MLINKVVNAAYGALTHGLNIALIASAALLLVSAAVAFTTGTENAHPSEWDLEEMVNALEEPPVPAIS